MKFDITRRIWTKITPKKSQDPIDTIPKIDSHSIVLYETEDIQKFYIVCGFIGGSDGKLSSSVYSYDIKENVSKCEF